MFSSFTRPIPGIELDFGRTYDTEEPQSQNAEKRGSQPHAVSSRIALAIPALGTLRPIEPFLAAEHETARKSRRSASNRLNKASPLPFFLKRAAPVPSRLHLALTSV